MSGDIAFEHDTEGCVVGERMRIVLHTMNQIPTLLKFEEFSENVEN
jgi:hypothetical protein